MNGSFFPNLWRFIGLTLLQGLVLRQIALNVGVYFNVLLYPLFILFLPIQLATPYLVLLGFFVGLSVDALYASWGVHASAGAFSAFMRGVILTVFEPKGGYGTKETIPSPGNFSWQWFLPMAGTFFLVHLLWYFSVEEFHFVYISKIVLKTVASWTLTMVFVIFYGFLFNPKL